jgi:acetolactate synthase-1/2/3 large subunit
MASAGQDLELALKMKSMLNLGQPSLDWVNIATGLGAPAKRAGTTVEFRQHFEAALGVKGPGLIECQVATPKEWSALEEYLGPFFIRFFSILWFFLRAWS